MSLYVSPLRLLFADERGDDEAALLARVVHVSLQCQKICIHVYMQVYVATYRYMIRGRRREKKRKEREREREGGGQSPDRKPELLFHSNPKSETPTAIALGPSPKTLTPQGSSYQAVIPV